MSGSTTLGKIVLQQVRVPTATLAAAGLDLTHLTKVTFTGAVGADGVPGGGVYLSDLGFNSKALGTPKVQARPTVNVASTRTEEGNGPGVSTAAVYLSRPSTTPVSAYLTVVGSATGKVGLAMQKVTFAPGTTCQVTDIPAAGDTVAGTTPTTAFKLGVSNSTYAVLGVQDFGTLTVREDDGVTGTATAAPPVGVQGDPCAEYEALSRPGPLTVGDSKPEPGAAVTLGGSGYRAGESVAFTLGSAALGSAVMRQRRYGLVPGHRPRGPGLRQRAGQRGRGGVRVHPYGVRRGPRDHHDGARPLPRRAPDQRDGHAQGDGHRGGHRRRGGHLPGRRHRPGLGPGQRRDGVPADPVGLQGGDAHLHRLVRGLRVGGRVGVRPGGADPDEGSEFLAMSLVANSTRYGHAVSGVFAVAGAKEGTVTVTYGTGSGLKAKVGASGTGTFKLPATLSVGAHTVSVSYDGTDFVAPSGVASQKLTVLKAKTTTALSLSKTKLARGKSQTVKVTVGGHSAGAYPTGTITVTAKVGGTTTTKKVSLSAAKKGVLSFSVTMPKKKGTATVTAVYAGNGSFLSSTSPHKKVTLT